MRAIVINPYDQSITETPVTTEVDMAGLNSFLKVDPHYSGCFDRVGLDDQNSVWIDDEGNLMEGRPVFEISNGEKKAFLTGVAIVLGDDEDKTVGTSLTVADIVAKVRWTNMETTGEFGESESGMDDMNRFIFITGQPIFREREKK